MEAEGTYRGSCFCGAVEFEVSGEPAAMGSSLRVLPALVRRPDQRLLALGHERGASNPRRGEYRRLQQEREQRPRVAQDLRRSRVHRAPGLGLTDVYAAVIPDLPYRPSVHVNYESTVLRLRDGLPKMKDLPAEMGGSGASLPE
ncbi:MAG TPA: GFA family protein [Burkholderiales bacterium]